MPPLSSPRALIRRQIVDLWGEGRTDIIPALYAPDVVDHMPAPGQPEGLGGLADVVAAFRAALPDLTLTVHAILQDGDRAVDVWTLEATHTGEVMGLAPRRARVRFSGIDMVRAVDGRIAELWHVEELARFADQAAGHAAPVPRPADAASPSEPAGAARLDRNRAIARRHLLELWGEGREDLAPDLYAPEVVDHMPAPGQRPGVPGLIDVLRSLREPLPDLRIDLHDLVADGDLVADRWTLTATHTGAPLMGRPPRGRPVRFHGMDVVRIRDDGAITDVWHVEEFLQLRRQLDEG